LTALEPPEDAPRVELCDQMATLWRGGEKRDFTLEEMPEKLARWQLESKHSVYDAIERDEFIPFNAGHLPVVATWGQDSLTPNLANKGVGFTPRDEYIEHYVDLVESAVEEIEKVPSHETEVTRALRLEAAREFYRHPEHVDWRRLGLLEIFEGTTYRNLAGNPFASVLWTGNAPVYLSYQVDCLVEIIERGDPRYRFAWAMRRLFEYEPFHIVQTIFPYAYCFWIIGSRDKTPKRRYPGKRTDNTVNEGHGRIDSQSRSS